MHKRDFVRTMSGGAAAMVFGPDINALFARYAHVPGEELAQDAQFWAAMRTKFKLTPNYINLENGYYCFQPEEVLDQFVGHVRSINEEASHYMRTVRLTDKARVAAKLAEMLGCSPKEVIITRNTTESLDTVVSGYDWKPGDEAVMANQDYGAMLDQFRLMERRYGTVNKYVDVPLLPKSDDEIVKVYADAITPKTRLLMVCHIVNITGHILPLAKISDMAHARGVDVMVDGAHAVAHFDYKIPDLKCDYYGSSLHKWLSAPLGSGLLYVKEDKIKNLWPVFSEFRLADDNILKLNHTGTHPCHTDLGIENAIAFHQAIGAQRKEARLRYIQQYWTSRVRGTPKIVLNTPEDPKRSCGIANVGIAGMKPADLAKTLLDKYKIFTVAIDVNGVHGVRVSPQIYTSIAELDAFVNALKEMASAA